MTDEAIPWRKREEFLLDKLREAEERAEKAEAEMVRRFTAKEFDGLGEHITQLETENERLRAEREVLITNWHNEEQENVRLRAALKAVRECYPPGFRVRSIADRALGEEA